MRNGRFESDFLTLRGKPNEHAHGYLEESQVQRFRQFQIYGQGSPT